MMLNYDPATHGAITAAMVYGTPKQFKVDLAFAFGGYVTADFTRDGLEPFLIGINSYTVWFDERATHDNKSRLKCIRLYLKNRYQPMAEEVYRDGEIKVFESDREIASTSIFCLCWRLLVSKMNGFLVRSAIT